MKTLLLLVVTAVLLSFPAPSLAASPGHFVYAGPISADADVLSIKWRFGFQFTIKPEIISSVSFACDPIPSTHMTVAAANLKIDVQGVSFIEATTVAVSKDTTPWLFDRETTRANCEAVVVTVNNEQLREEALVSFTPSTKAILLVQMEDSFKYNKLLKSRSSNSSSIGSPTADATVPSSAKDYTILSKSTSGGDTMVYGLACNNGTPMCNYKWDSSLCKSGAPHNTSPFGNDAGNVPGYAVMDGKRVRLFICK